jgi:hypothetical protein
MVKNSSPFRDDLMRRIAALHAEADLLVRAKCS